MPRIRKSGAPHKLWNPLSITLLVSTGLLAVSILMVPMVRSPAQAAADAVAPAVTRQTVAITTGQVSDSVSVNGTISPSNERVLRTTVPAEASKALVSLVAVTLGGDVVAGQVVFAVSGRPLIVLPGNVPVFRALGPGDTGTDVAELQDGLRALGLSIADPTGTYGTTTSSAVTKLYADRGYVPTTLGTQEVAAAAQAVTGAQRARDDAQTALTRAQKALRAVDPTDAAAKQSVQYSVADAQLALSRLNNDLATALAAQRKAVASSGASIQLGEMEFVPELPAKATDVSIAVNQAAGEGSVTVSTGALIVMAELPGAVHQLVAADQTADVITENGDTLKAKVASVSSRASSTAGQGTDTVWRAALDPTSPIVQTLRGQDVRVIITTKISDTGLVVPVTCVTTGSDGRTRVSILRTGVVTEVEVALGQSGGGMVRINPVSGKLSAGESAVVGG